MKTETQIWDEVRAEYRTQRVLLGTYTSYNLLKNPRSLLFSLSRYKFASKMIGSGKRIIEVGCSDGFRSNILAEFSKEVIGVDIDSEAVQEASASIKLPNVQFKNADFMSCDLGKFDALVSMDVIEHIQSENENKFFSAVKKNLNETGMAVIGTPNKNAEAYASLPSRVGHINLYTQERLKNVMEQNFKFVQMFSMNDEVVHTGYHNMAHYLIAVGIMPL